MTVTRADVRTYIRAAARRAPGACLASDRGRRGARAAARRSPRILRSPTCWSRCSSARSSSTRPSRTGWAWRRMIAGVNRWGAGLNFVGKTVLRASVVLMGLRIEARLSNRDSSRRSARRCVTVLPTTYFVTQLLAVPLGVSAQAGRSVAAGTMICGASAVNAVAPVIGARRQEQGVALATIFLYSAVALVLFRVARAGGGRSDGPPGRPLERAGRERSGQRRRRGRADGPRRRGDGGRQQVGARADAGAGAGPVLALAGRTGRARGRRRRRMFGRSHSGLRPRIPASSRSRAPGATRLFGAGPPGTRPSPSTVRSSPSRPSPSRQASACTSSSRDLLVGGRARRALGAVAAATMSGLTLALVLLAGRGLNAGLFSSCGGCRAR